MSLWRAHFLGKADTIPDPILDEIPVVHMDPNMPPIAEVKTQTGTYYQFGKKGNLRTANGFLIMEQFAAGTTLKWMYPFDEFHFIVKGECDMTYSLFSTANTVTKFLHVKAGDFFVTPLGSTVEFKMWDKGPLCRFCGVMPGRAQNAVQLSHYLREK